MDDEEQKYPKYFILDVDIPCMLYIDDEEMVCGVNYLGSPKGIGKILSEAVEVTKEEYDIVCEKLTSKNKCKLLIE